MVNWEFQIGYRRLIGTPWNTFNWTSRYNYCWYPRPTCQILLLMKKMVKYFYIHWKETLSPPNSSTLQLIKFILGSLIQHSWCGFFTLEGSMTCNYGISYTLFTENDKCWRGKDKKSGWNTCQFRVMFQSQIPISFITHPWHNLLTIPTVNTFMIKVKATTGVCKVTVHTMYDEPEVFLNFIPIGLEACISYWISMATLDLWPMTVVVLKSWVQHLLGFPKCFPARSIHRTSELLWC